MPVRGEKAQPTEEELAFLADYLATHPAEVARKEAAPATLRECGPEIVALRKMDQEFREKHDLDALHAITKVELPSGVPMTSGTLTDTIRANHVRDSARLDLNKIENTLKTIEGETDITDAEYEQLYKELYLPLTSVVGVVEDDGNINHEIIIETPRRSRSKE